MQHKCSDCPRKFPSLTALLNHRKTAHARKPVINVTDAHPIKKKPVIVIASHNHPDIKLGKRKAQSNDAFSNASKKIIRLDYDNNDPQIIEVSDDEKPYPKLNVPSLHDTELDNINRLFDQAPTPPRLSPIPTGTRSLPVDYKELYDQLHKKCGEMITQYKDQIQKLKEINARNLKDIENKNDAEVQKVRNEFQIQLKNMIEAKEVECKEKLNANISEFNTQMKHLESKKDMACEEKLKRINLEHERYIKQLQADQQKQLTEVEKECTDKLQRMQAIIKNFEDEDDSETAKLSNVIFNCATLEDIYEVQSLIEKHQFNQLTTKHLHTLQNLLLGLSLGIVPICEPQRRALSETQKKLVSDIQNSSLARAKSLINNNRQHFIDFMNKIKDSIKLISSSYNRYGGI